MTASQERYLAEVRRIVLAHLDPREAGVYLFGSFARDDVRVFSDIDVAVLPKNGAIDRSIAKASEALEESVIPYRVEIVDLSHAGEEFRTRVLATGIPWTA